MYNADYHREYERKRYSQRVARMKAFLGGACVACGTADGLEIHHKDPKGKQFVLTSIYGHPWSKIESELIKCELRCKHHHLERHATDHGRGRMYKNGCRCILCVEKNRFDTKNSQARTRGMRRAIARQSNMRA